MKRLLVVLLIVCSIILNIGANNHIASADGDACLTDTTPGCTNGLPTDEYQRLLADMQAHPSPEVTQIPVNAKEVGAYSFFRVLPGTVVYDKPNGTIIDRLENGFSFVIIHGIRDGFAELRNGTWVRRSSLKQTYASMFSGVTFNGPLPYPMAWVIQASIPSTFPGAPNNSHTAAIKRYTRVYIYATVHVGQWDWYLVGPGQWLEQRKVARVIPATRPDGVTGKWVSVDLFEQVLTAYDGDNLLFATLVSTGLPGWQTEVGTFKVWNRVSATAMVGAMGEADFYSLPAVPYAMFFDNDISLHGTYWHDGFGFKHSHGCVNMSITDAHWVYDWISDGDLTVSVIDGHTATAS